MALAEKQMLVLERALQACPRHEAILLALLRCTTQAGLSA